jgi:hypothetical protein
VAEEGRKGWDGLFDDSRGREKMAKFQDKTFAVQRESAGGRTLMGRERGYLANLARRWTSCCSCSIDVYPPE